MVKKKISTNNEIDLVELFFLIYKNIFKIILFIVLSVILMSIHISLSKKEVVSSVYEFQTEIRSISTYDEFEYEIYNNFIQNSFSKIIKYPVKSEGETFIVNEVMLDTENTSFKKIDKDYLINLFIEKLSDRDFIIKTMREFKFMKENDIDKYADSFRLSVNKNTKDRDKMLKSKSWLLSSKYENIDKFKNYLRYLEKETNNEIRLYVYDSFQKMIENQRKIKRYKIEDIDLLKETTDEFTRGRLEMSKQNILKSKYIDRLIFSFKKTPILDQKRFTAGNILTNSINYKNLSTQTMGMGVQMKYLISIIIGTIVGLFYVILANSIKNRL